MRADTWVWIEGQVVPADTAMVSASDRGLLLGDGLFETMPIIDGHPFALTRHLSRLRLAADAIEIALPWDDDHLRSACRETARSLVAPLGRMRVTVTAGRGAPGLRRSRIAPALVITVGPFLEPATSARVAVSPWPLNERSPVAGLKTISQLDHVAAVNYAAANEADEAIVMNTRGVLAEGACSNLFLVVDGRLATPALATGCLPGIVRSLVLETVGVVERDDLTIDDLRTAPEAFLTSSLRGAQPISRVDQHDLRFAPGPLTTQAIAALRALRARTIDP